MFKKNCVIEVGDNYLIKHDFCIPLLNRVYKKYEYNINLLKDAQFYVSNRKAYIVLEGEKINIKKMTFPKMKNKDLYKLIVEELASYYSNTDKIFFNFSIIKESGNSVEVIVFYSNEGKIKKLEKYILGNSHIKGVYLIQFCFLRYFSAAIMQNDFAFAFMYKSKLYFLYCINKKMLYNHMVTCGEDITKINELLFEFIESCRINNGTEIRNVYIANINEKICADVSFEGYSVKNLGDVNEKTLIRSIKNNRR